MRITFVLPQMNLSGGMRVVAIYAERLRRRGHEVVVVSTPAPRPRVVEKVRAVLRGRLSGPRPRQSPSWFDGLDVDHRVIDRLRPVTDRDVPDADVVVATWWETAEWVHGLAASKGAKAYLVQHHEIFEYLPLNRVHATYRLPLHKIAVSQWICDSLVQHYGPQEMAVVPNAVDAAEFHAAARGKQMTPTIGMMYSGVPWKHSELGLKAWELASRQIPNLKLVMFGHDRPSDATLRGGSEFHHQPTLEVVRNCYGKCDAWLFTSLREGFGLPIVEAMACRTPVIATPAGAAPQLLAGGGGVLLNAADPRAMANAIIDVARMSDTTWRQMSDRALATATSYTWDDATDRLETALSRIVQANRGNPGKSGNPGNPGDRESANQTGLSSAVEVVEVREALE